jgi:hypothetical protein
MEKYYPELKDGKIGEVKVNFVIQSDNDKINYQKKLDEAIEAQKGGSASEGDIVDLFAAENDFVGKYAMKARDAAYTFEQIGITSDDLANTAPNAIGPATDEDGKVRGINLEGNASGMIFKKSIAKDALGTDDPAEVQAMVSSWDGMKEVGEKLKAKGYFLHQTPDDMQRPFIMSDTTAFGENETLVATPGMNDWIAYAKDCCDKGYVAVPGATMWSDEYMAGYGKKGKTFCYSFANWFNGWPMPGNADDAKGDWCIIQGPQAFSWGGTFLFAANGTDNSDLCKQVIMGLGVDEKNLETWAKDGNYTSNKNVNAKFAGKPAESGFFSNEDFFGTLDELAAADTTQGGRSAYDSQCVESVWPIIADYFTGKETDLNACIGKWQDEVIKTWANLSKG